MKHFWRYILVGVYLLYFSSLVFSQSTCTNVNLTAVSEPSLCRASGTISVSVTGEDINKLDLATAQYQILSVGQGYSTQLTVNGGVFNNVPPGEYNIVMKAFCSISNDWSVFTGKVSVKVEAKYIEPNMYIVTEEVRKTLNCKLTGMIPVSFFDGKGPYTATLTSWPSGYTGEKVFTRSSSGRLEIDNLPEGDYTLSLNDDCGTRRDDLSAKISKVSSDFPTGGYVSDSDLRAFANNSTTDCKRFSYVNLRFNPVISESHELFPYLKNASTFYDIFLSEENKLTESQGTLSTTSITSPNINYLSIKDISLIDYTYKDLYPADGKKADLFLRVKGCAGATSPKIPFSLRKPYYSALNVKNFTCDGFDLYVSQYTDYDGIICYPYTVNVIDADSKNIITSNVIYSSSSSYAGTVPWGRYTIQYIGKDGGEWFPSSGTSSVVYTMNPIAFKSSASRLSYCRADGATGSISIGFNNNISTYFVPGTRVKVISAPIGQEIPPEQTITAGDISTFYPYSIITGSSGNYSPILAGDHEFEITLPCPNITPQRVKVTFPKQTALSYYTSYGSGSCKNTSLEKFYSYFYSQDTYIPGGTTITFVSGPVGANLNAIKHGYPTPFTMPSGTSKYFTPFDTDFTSTGYTDNIVTPGTYLFDVWDSNCQSTTRVSLTVPSVYTLSDFAYTMEYTSCSNIEVYPKGQIKLGNSNSTTYFKIYSAKNANGTTMSTADYDTRTITQGKSLVLSKNGTYILQVSSGGSCFSDTLSIIYQQPTPNLLLNQTSSYVCSGETRGYIKLKATGGYGNGPYLYEIVESNPLLTNETGIFDYGMANENLTIKVTDKSPKAVLFGCNPSFEQQITMLNLEDASVAYSTNNGEYCVGQTIYLNCISLGNTTYDWTGPNGFAQTGQFLTISNANLGHSGWYFVEVHPENCGDIKRDSVLIKVNPLPSIPLVSTPDIILCYNSGSYNLTTISGATPAQNHSLKWYLVNGNIVVNPIINSYTNTKLIEYYVSQVNNTTGCESDKVHIQISIADRPSGAVIKYHPDVCYRDSVNITVLNSNPLYDYRLYNTTSINGLILDQKAGTGAELKFNPQEFNSTGTTYTWYVSVLDRSTGCESTRSAQVVTRAASGQVANILVEWDTICYGTSTALIASAPEIVNPIYRWYNGTSITSTLLYVGDTYNTPNLTTTTNYYVSVQGENICENLPGQRKQVTVRVLPYSQTYYITATNPTICQHESTTINLSSSYVTIAPIYYNWYTSQTETVPFFTGNSYTTPPLSTNTNYYIGVYNKNQYCENLVNNRKIVTVTTVSKAEVLAPDACPTTIASITISNARANIEYKVYEQATGGALLGTGKRTSTGSLPISIGTHTSSNTFYVQTNDAYCASTPFTPFTLNVKDAPTIYPDIRLQVCPESGTQLNLTGYLNQKEFQSVVWTNNQSIPISGGNNINLGLLNPTQTYKFRFDVKNSCYTRTGVLYIKTLSNNGTSYYPPKELRICKDHATGINLLELMGVIEVSGGVWDFSSLGTNYTEYIKLANGAVLFDGEKAFTDSKGDPDLNIAGARRVKFIYTSSPNTCNVPEQTEITLILTPSLL